MLMKAFPYYKALQIDLLADLDHLTGIFCQAALIAKNLQRQSHQSLSTQDPIAVN
jgi:hypothetical protein